MSNQSNWQTEAFLAIMTGQKVPAGTPFMGKAGILTGKAAGHALNIIRKVPGMDNYLDGVSMGVASVASKESISQKVEQVATVISEKIKDACDAGIRAKMATL